MKKRLLQVLCAGLTVAATPVVALAAPLSPQVLDVSGQFSATVQYSFQLLADTDDAKLVYYVPRRGGVAVQSPLSTNPIPRFSISSRVPTYGFWAGTDLGQMGGSMSTMGDIGALQLLQREAQNKGYRVAPAPVSKAGVKFLMSGQANPVTGRIDVQCTMGTIVVNGKNVPVPNCYTRHSPEVPYDLDTNVMYKFVYTPMANSSTVAQDLSFQATTLPDWTPLLRNKMMTGSQWDDILSAQVDWQIRTYNLTRQARIYVNWRALFEQASTFTAYHNYSCIDVEVRDFFRRLTQCQKENECGVRVEFMRPDGTYGPIAPNDPSFVSALNAFEVDLREELFNEVRLHTTPVNGQVSGNTTAAYTMRANYERLILEKNEIRYFTYNPGPSDFESTTHLNVTCLRGGFEEGRVNWDMNDSGCRALLGQ